MGDTNSLLANLKAKKAGAQPAAPDPGQGLASKPAAAPSPPAPLGINPPEKDLPPPEPKAPRKTTRGAPKDPVGADVHAATDPRQMPLPFEAINYDKLATLIVDQIFTKLIEYVKGRL